MSEFNPRAAGYEMPGEDPDQLTAAATRAIAASAGLNETVAMQQRQLAQTQQMVQQSQEMVTTMRMAVMDMQAQMNSMKYVPVIAQVVATSGILVAAPVEAMTGALMERSIGADGSVHERFEVRFDPVGLFDSGTRASHAQNEEIRARGDAQAVINHSKSVISKWKGNNGPSR